MTRPTERAGPGAPIVRSDNGTLPTGGIVEFKGKGEVTMSGPEGAYDLQYSRPDETAIVFHRPNGRTTIRWKILSLQADELLIKDDRGNQVLLRRAVAGNEALRSNSVQKWVIFRASLPRFLGCYFILGRSGSIGGSFL